MRDADAPGSRAAPEAARQEPRYELRLYVAGNLPNSLIARENLLDICRTYLDGRHTLEVVDFLQEPRRALEEGIIATPTLVKVAPEPSCTIVGTLADRAMVLRALDLQP